jgi:peptidoglycan/LPS O-acetylase OafA/YrhL
MKTIYLPIFLLTWVLVLSGMWIIHPGSTEPTVLEYIYVGAIICFFVLSVIFAFARNQRKRKGFPEDDELSKMVDQKSTAIAYFASVILWLCLVLIQRLIGLEMKWMVALGIIGMAVSFVISWLIINTQTFKDEK